MRLSELIARIPIISRGGAGDPDISDVTFDSRLVGPGALYVSIPGFTTHGDRFIAEAIHKGAAAIMSENPQPDCSAPWVQVDNPRETLGIAAQCVFGEVHVCRDHRDQRENHHGVFVSKPPRKVVWAIIGLDVRDH